MAMDQERNARARDAAFTAAMDLPVEPTSRVTFHSQGRVLVIGMDEGVVLDAARRLREHLRPSVLLTTAGEARELDGIPVLYSHGREPLIEGYLGRFRVTLEVGAQAANVATLLHSNWEHFDLVLDLGMAPLIPAEWPPIGYFSPGLGDDEALDRAIANLADLKGEFEKPKFFSYDPEICAHGRSGISGCTRCLDACPAIAIRSLGETIEVQPELCQGGGICATVCPTGAIIYSYPRPADLMERLQALLGTYRDHGGVEPIVLFYDDEAGNDALQSLEPLPGQILAVEVDEIGSVGLDALLGCLAAGAREVILLDTPALPRKVRRNLLEQLGHAHAILQALGFPPDALRLAPADACTGLPDDPMPALRPERIAGSNRKRATLFRALDHLNAEAPAPQTEIPLSRGAPFGEVRVDRDACTLCMACASVCPAKALSAPGDVPRLDFTEGLCVQCGICERSCPERAISLRPRLITDPGRRDERRALNEEEPFECISCGKPFATRSMIDRMTQRLQGHWMFQDEQSVRRLMMCENCRVIDMFTHGGDRKI
jgi:ferredoxin